MAGASVTQVSFDDVAVIFSGDEWEMLNVQQRTLYMEVMRENYEHFVFLGSKVPIILSWLQNDDTTTKGSTPVSTDARGPSVNRKRSLDTSAKENRDLLSPVAEVSKETETPGKKNCKRSRRGDSDAFQNLNTSNETQLDPMSPPHGRNLRKRKQFFCSQCEKCFKYSSALDAHMRVHNGDKPHKCDICKKDFSYKSALIVHRRQHSQASTSATQPLENRSPLNHFITPAPTPTSSAASSSSSSTSTGAPSPPANFSLVPGEKPLKCNFCEKRFNDKSILDAHHRIHTGKLAYPCNLCDESFSKPSLLAAHNNTHREGKPYQCDQCDKNFNDQSLLVAHKRTHTGEKPHKCNHCNKWFPNCSSLVEHEQTHLKPKPYKCRHCEKSFNDKSLLTTHEGVHTDTKPFKCPQCNESFFLKTQLVAHQATHAPDKPYPCSQCERSFNKKETLLAHIRVHNLQNMQTQKARRQ